MHLPIRCAARTARAVLATIALVASTACHHLETVSPAGVDLSGTWQLDPKHSDAPPPPPRPHESADARMGGEGGPHFGGPAPLLPMVSATRMTIAQDRDSMGIAYPNQPYRDVKWGEQKRNLYVVDAGWRDDRLIVQTKSQPMTVSETYSLSGDGNTLTLLIELSAKRGDQRLTRVFTRVTDPTQQPH